MDHFASLVPNHEYGCGTICHCFCEVSVIVFAVCEKAVVTRDYWNFVVILGLSSLLHNSGTKIGMGSDQSYEPQLHLPMASLVVVWLSYLQTPQLICIIHVVHVVEVTDVLKIVW